MANEIKNRQHAIGLFAPVPASPFTTPIVSSVGIASFTRNGPGNYTLALQDAAPFATHAVEAGMGANVLGTIGGQIAPDGGSVLVTAFDALGAPFDPSHFDLVVNTIRDGEGVGPAPALPPVPASPSGVGILGWVRVSAAGAIVQQSASAIIQSVAAWAGNPGVSVITLVPGAVAGAALASQDQAVQAGVEWMAQVVDPTTVNVQAGIGPTPNGAYYCAIFGL